MKDHKLTTLALSAMLAVTSAQAVDALHGKTVLDTKCVACHTGTSATGLSRIADQRKTPEGWYMTLERMKRHGLALSADEERDVIKYLSDTQGLAPEEIRPFRYVLDQTPGVIEANVDPKLEEMCVRCHSEARIGLQRRTAAEWNLLANYHVATFSSFEIQALARDRDWFGIAQKETAPYLGERFGKETTAWSAWKPVIPSVTVAGDWNVLGHAVGRGDYVARITLTKNKDDSYTMKMVGKYADDKPLKASGEAILYTGTEFRASLTLDGTDMRQVLHLDPQTGILEGRMFSVEHPELGSDLRAQRSDAGASILGVTPTALKSGEAATLTIVGSHLEGKIVLGDGIKLNKIVSRDADRVIVNVTPLKRKGASAQTIRVGKAGGEVILYENVEKIEVFPAYVVARVGGGHSTKQLAAFEAHGFAQGANGPIDLGMVPGVSWKVDNFDEQAAEDKDATYAGTMDAASGVFTPAEAGRNFSRKWGTNNAGRLSVVGSYPNDGTALTSKAELIVTVQKWVNPPIQ